MPDVILDVLSLTVKLCRDQFHAADYSTTKELETAGTCCEIWPAWEIGGTRFVTTHGGPAERDAEDSPCWKHVSSQPPHAPNRQSKESDPLMAILVSVPPPGGLAALSKHRLSVSVVFSHAERSKDAFAWSESELLLKDLITAQENQPFATAIRSNITCNNETTVTGELHAVLMWHTLPLGMRDLFGPSNAAPNLPAEQSEVTGCRATSPKKASRCSSACSPRKVSPSLDERSAASSPTKAQPASSPHSSTYARSFVGPAGGSGGRASPMGRRLGRPVTAAGTYEEMYRGVAFRTIARPWCHDRSAQTVPITAQTAYRLYRGDAASGTTSHSANRAEHHTERLVRMYDRAAQTALPHLELGGPGRNRGSSPVPRDSWQPRREIQVSG